MFGGCLLLAYFTFVKKWDNSQLQEDKIRAEERVKILEVEKAGWHSLADSLKTQVAVTEGIVEYQKKNPAIIREKYEKIRSDVNLLTSDSAIGLLSIRLSKESGNR